MSSVSLVSAQLYLHEQLAKSRLMKVCFVAWGLSVLWTINPVSVSGSLDPLASRPCSPAGGSATLSFESRTDSVYLQNGV